MHRVQVVLVNDGALLSMTIPSVAIGYWPLMQYHRNMRLNLGNRIFAALTGSAAFSIALMACKPPPTDDASARGTLASAPEAPSPPIDSPDTTNSIWANSATPGRILFGNPGERPLLAVDCLDGGMDSARIRFTRFAPADEGAGAFMALVGNFHVVRMPVDATEIGTSWVWQGDISVDDPDLEALTGRREVTLTIPGAGKLTLLDTEVPRNLIYACRAPIVDEAETLDPETIDAPGLEASAD